MMSSPLTKSLWIWANSCPYRIQTAIFTQVRSSSASFVCSVIDNSDISSITGCSPIGEDIFAKGRRGLNPQSVRLSLHGSSNLDHGDLNVSVFLSITYNLRKLRTSLAERASTRLPRDLPTYNLRGSIAITVGEDNVRGLSTPYIAQSSGPVTVQVVDVTQPPMLDSRRFTSSWVELTDELGHLRCAVTGGGAECSIGPDSGHPHRICHVDSPYRRVYTLPSLSVTDAVTS